MRLYRYSADYPYVAIGSHPVVRTVATDSHPVIRTVATDSHPVIRTSPLVAILYLWLTIRTSSLAA